MHSLAIKLEGLEKRKRNAPALHMAAALVLFAKTLDYTHEFDFQNWVSFIPFFLLAFASLLYGLKMKAKDTEGKYNHWLRLAQLGAFALLGFLFLNIPGVIDEIITFVYAGISLFLYIVEKRVFKDLYLHIRKEGIDLPGDYANKLLEWPQVKDVVARPDYITIFKDKNSYLQLELLHNEGADKLENINHFCRQQIQQNN
jgi:hypothetical protein